MVKRLIRTPRTERTAMRLLVSPRNMEEAREAIAGGTDILDIKNPAEGSLGSNFPWVVRSIREMAPAGMEISCAIGDMPDLPGTASMAALGAAHAGADYVKFGLLGPKTRESAVTLARAVVRAVKDEFAEVRIVVAGYGDHLTGNTIPPLEVPDIATASGCDVAMLDTLGKRGSCLFDHIGPDGAARFVDACHDHGLQAALAGNIGIDHLDVLKDTGCDIVGVRGAACEGGDRSSQLRGHLVRELAELVRQG
jgi:hypothetical protein